MKVLAIGCHPDDLEIGCGGTLARMVSEGHEVYMCHVCNGDMGHMVIMPDELGKMREKEAENGGAVLGVKKVYNVNVGDCMIYSHDQDARREVIKIIREVRPDFIITHDPNDYHEDHVQVQKLVCEASFTASVAHMFPEYPVYEVVPVYFMDNLAGVNFLPEEYVDVTDYIDTKIKALECHESQLKWMLEHDKIDFAEFVKSCSRFRGLQSGVQYAEGFRAYRAHLRQTTKRLLP